ncbi:hypothetical protein PIB30_042293 [Stylosanthes scabra]|uniref:Uncharacterized protein n=1 Tax=Stylosanthes scabra TaxID=79078 RepID=A0ABU6WH89_9FABA|nr:hypothetical protein [Stylosanthes scabra]
MLPESRNHHTLPGNWCCFPPASHHIWRAAEVEIPLIIDDPTPKSIQGWWIEATHEAGRSLQGKRRLSLIATLLWKIWNAQDSVVFENHVSPPHVLARSAIYS